MESERKIVVKQATIIKSSNWITIEDYKGPYTSPEEALGEVKQIDEYRNPKDWHPRYLRWIESTDERAYFHPGEIKEILGKERAIALVNPRGGHLVWVDNIHNVLPSVLFRFRSKDASDT